AAGKKRDDRPFRADASGDRGARGARGGAVEFGAGAYAHAERLAAVGHELETRGARAGRVGGDRRIGWAEDAGGTERIAVAGVAHGECAGLGRRDGERHLVDDGGLAAPWLAVVAPGDAAGSWECSLIVGAVEVVGLRGLDEE